MQCGNNLKQLALGCVTHEQQHGTLPTGGWVFWWFGDPDRGFDRHQPGGWIYNILPYIEQGTLREIGAGMAPAAKKTALVRVAQTALATLRLPHGRQPVLYPNTVGQDNVDAYPQGLAALGLRGQRGHEPGRLVRHFVAPATLRPLPITQSTNGRVLPLMTAYSFPPARYAWRISPTARATPTWWARNI